MFIPTHNAYAFYADVYFQLENVHRSHHLFGLVLTFAGENHDCIEMIKIIGVMMSFQIILFCHSHLCRINCIRNPFKNDFHQTEWVNEKLPDLLHCYNKRGKRRNHMEIVQMHRRLQHTYTLHTNATQTTTIEIILMGWTVDFCVYVVYVCVHTRMW